MYRGLALYILAATLLIVPLSIGVVSLMNRLTRGPLRFRIEPGEEKAGPRLRAYRFWGGLMRRQPVTMTFTFDLENVPVGKVLKLYGVAPVTPRHLWPPAARQVQRYGLGEWFSVTHWQSYRFLGIVRERKGRKVLVVRTYTYNDAVGGLYEGEHPARVPSKTLGFARSGEPFTLTIRPAPAVIYYGFARGAARERPSHQQLVEQPALRSVLWARTFAHDDNGPSAGRIDDAPICFTAQKP